MKTVLLLTVLTAYAVVAIRSEAALHRNRKPLSVFINQTSTGLYWMYNGSEIVKKMPTTWYQNDLTKKLRVDVGVFGEEGWDGTFFFDKDGHHAVMRQAGKIVCVRNNVFSYTDEINNYDERFMGYVGRHLMGEFDDRPAEVYAGQVLDAVGLMNVVLHIDPFSGAYLGLIATGAYKKFSYIRYYLDKSTQCIPPDSVYTLPTECNQPIKLDASKMKDGKLHRIISIRHPFLEDKN